MPRPLQEQLSCEIAEQLAVWIERLGDQISINAIDHDDLFQLNIFKEGNEFYVQDFVSKHWLDDDASARRKGIGSLLVNTALVYLREVAGTDDLRVRFTLVPFGRDRERRWRELRSFVRCWTDGVDDTTVEVTIPLREIIRAHAGTTRAGASTIVSLRSFSPCAQRPQFGKQRPR